MDDMEDDARYPPKSFTLNRQNPSLRQKHPIRGTPYHRSATTRYEEDDDEDEEPEEFNDYDDEEDDDNEGENGYGGNFEDDDGFLRNQKKRKVRGGSSSVSNYEFAPRAAKFSYGNRSSEEWTEHATFVLLEVWGDKFLQLGRNSLRSEEWHEVAEKVSEELKVERTVPQCRSVLDKLKRRYKKEKSRMDEMGLGVNSSKWAFFKKMDMLMSSSARQEYGLACGVDSGEYVFMNTRVYLNRSNGFDEMRDSPGESETSGDDDSDGLAGESGGGAGGGDEEEDEEDETSFRVLADSIQKFGKIYEKIENTKRQQMMELEKMRLDFNRELELQKKQILERAQAEIAKIQDGDEEDSDSSAENLSE